MYKCSSCDYTTDSKRRFEIHRALCMGRSPIYVNWGGPKKPRINWNTGIAVALIALFLALYSFQAALAAATCTIYVGRSGSVMLNVKSLPPSGYLSYYYYGIYKGRVNRAGVWTIGKPVANEGSRHWSAGRNECSG